MMGELLDQDSDTNSEPDLQIFEKKDRSNLMKQSEDGDELKKQF